MTPDQIRLIQHSFAKVATISDQVAALFYGRLFEVAPSVKPLFRGRKLMATRATVVNGLDALDTVLPAASALAKRHVAYGVERRHYAAVGETLLWTLERGLGSQWTSDLAAAWGGGLRDALHVHDQRGLRPHRGRRVMGRTTP